MSDELTRNFEHDGFSFPVTFSLEEVAGEKIPVVSQTDLGCVIYGTSDRATGSKRMSQLVDRNRELEDPDFSHFLKMKNSAGYLRDTRVYTQEGVLEVCYFAKTEFAKKFRKFSSKCMLELMKGKTVSIAPQSPAQQLLAQARVMVDIEQKQREQQQRIEALETDSATTKAAVQFISQHIEAQGRKPHELTSFEVADRLHWYSSKGNAHGRAVVAAARNSDLFKAGFARVHKYVDSNGTFVNVTYLTKEGMETLRAKYAQYGEMSVKSRRITYSVFVGEDYRKSA